MLKVLQALWKRPEDKTIRIYQVLFAILLLVAFGYNFIYLEKELNFVIFGKDLTNIDAYFRYAINILAIPSLLIGLFKIQLFKAKYTRYWQVFLWIILMFISSTIVPETINIDVDFLLNLMGLVSIIVWISGKMITKDGLRYWEKITKIRV